jgi:putative ATPase
LEPLSDQQVGALLDRAVDDERGLGGTVTLEPAAREHLVRLSGGDARRGLTYLEAAAGAALSRERPVVDVQTAALAVDRAAVRYDRQGDQHYDVTSALIKSIRGSDVDAALHYLARMVEAGEDPRFLSRRLINLAQAVISLCLSPKSNAVITAIDAAVADVRAGRLGAVPAALRDAHYPGAKALGHGHSYRYAHDDPRGVAPQQHAPDEVDDREYYVPTRRGAELEYADRLARIRAILREDRGS